MYVALVPIADKVKAEPIAIGENDPDDDDGDEDDEDDEDDDVVKLNLTKCFLESIVKTNATRGELMQDCATVRGRNS